MGSGDSKCTLEIAKSLAKYIKKKIKIYDSFIILHHIMVYLYS